jgi:hypothetical protein
MERVALNGSKAKVGGGMSNHDASGPEGAASERQRRGLVGGVWGLRAAAVQSTPTFQPAPQRGIGSRRPSIMLGKIV